MSKYIYNEIEKEIQEDLIKHQFFIVTNNTTTKPVICNLQLHITNQNINTIWLRTINFLNLQILDISNNKVAYLPDIYTLKILKCSNNMLRELPTYMPILEELECDKNLLKAIPLYKSLVNLNCSENLIENIPELPKLRKLNISDNPIIDINIPTLTSLIAYDCPIILIRKNPLLTRRSSKLLNNSFKWVVQSSAKIDTDKIVIDWNISKMNVKPTIKNRLYKFLFE